MRTKPRLNFGQLAYLSMHGLYHFFLLYIFSRLGVFSFVILVGTMQLASNHLESFVWICTINDQAHTLKPEQNYVLIQLQMCARVANNAC